MKTTITLMIMVLLTGAARFASAQISGDTTLCRGETATYNAPVIPGASYGWSVTGGNIMGAANADSVVIFWSNAGIATLMVNITWPNNTTASYFLNLSVHPKPQPKITHVPYPVCPSSPGGDGSVGQEQHGKDDCEKVCKYATITYLTALNVGSTYQWVINGALSYTGAMTNTVTVTWDTTAFGSLVVYETNQWGCTDSSYVCIEKIDLPVAQFTHQMNVCKGSTVFFNNTSTGAVTYQWFFGDGSTSALEHPTHVYANGGTYTITLIAFNKCHCSDTVQSTITVSSLPGPDITCPSTICAFDTATYSTSQAGCIYSWVAIGGTISGPSNQQSVTVAWGAGQIGYLGLVVSGCGSVCSDTTWVRIPIIPAVATISGPNKVCPGDCATYSLPLFSGAVYTWSLNSGSCGTISDSTCCEEIEICWPSYIFNCTDTLTVTYYDSFLNCGGTAQIIIRVRPRLQVLGQPQGCSNGTSFFSAFGGIVCNWNISPAGPVLSPNPSPSLSVSWNGATGNFIITAVPVNPNQVCDDSASIIVNVVNPPSAPVIGGDTVVCQNNTYQYCATGNGNTQWIITGGSPSTASGNCVNVTWGNTPPFSVKAFDKMALPPYCSSDTAILAINTILSLPTPAISGPSIVCANGTSSFSTGTSYPAGTTYSWSISPANAGSVVSGQGSNSIQLEWGNNAPQTVVINLTVSLCGLTTTNSITVTLSPAPTPSVIQNGTLCPGGTAQLTVTGGAFTTYQWSGPGGFSATTNPATITQSGLYQVTVSVAGGCTALSQINVQYAGMPIASISTADPLQYCIGTPYTANLCALGNGSSSYQWNNAATTQCIAVSSPGSYWVTVTNTSTGCFAVSNVLTISEDSCQGGGPGTCVPMGSISFTHSSCNPKIFTNTSVNGSSFTWYFGDNTSSNATSPSHYYTQAGFYLVTLTGYVPDASGMDSCLLTDTAHIEIPLVADFSISSGCFGTPACFTDLSAFTAGNNITSWIWNFGDASFSTLQNPCHTYAAPGTYIVSLTIQNSNCATSHTDTVVILPKPNAAFNFSGNACVNSPVLFTDNSTTSINYWNWSFGNGGTSLNQNPTQTYTGAGIDTVTLIVHDIYGCYDTTSQVITINPPSISGPITAFPDTVVCAGTAVILAAPSCGTCSYLWSNGSANDSITVTTTGIYQVTVTDANGCDWVGNIRIIVNQPPLVIINGTTHDLCLGGYTFLTVPYNINWLNNWISNDPAVNGQVVNSVFVNPPAPGTYFYQVFVLDTATGCSDTSLPYMINVHVPPVPPLITAGSPSVVCQGDSIMLIGFHPDPTVNLEWNTGEVNDTIWVTFDGCYKLTATDTNGCESVATFCVTVNSLPDLCSFYEGCYDTCAPYTIMGPAGGSSYQWFFNGNPINGATSQSYTASASGCYSVAVTNSYGCSDTTGCLNLYLYPCPDSLCADIILDSIYCDPESGLYTMAYHVVNLSMVMLTEVHLQALPPNLSLAYAPNMILDTILPGDTSSQLIAAIYNGVAGDTLCFRSHVSAYDSAGMEILCCHSDTICYVLPECPPDTSCCYFSILSDSIWCHTGPTGEKEYHFSLEAAGCGNLYIFGQAGTTFFNSNPLALSGNPVVITGTFSNPAGLDTLCISFIIADTAHCCGTETICMVLPECPPPALPCEWKYPEVICQGSSATFQYYVFMPATSYNWQFPGGIPSTASGTGPHSVYYPVAGTYLVQLTITNNQGTTVCYDSIQVVAPPAATVILTGTTLFAQPSGMNYQWYLAPVSPGTLIPGATSQYFSPAANGIYCVVAYNYLGCADTACIDYFPQDTGCCYLNFMEDSIWCVTAPDGSVKYHFQLQVSGCGKLYVSTPVNGTLVFNYPQVLTAAVATITGTFSGAVGQNLCMTFVVHDSLSYCVDTTICYTLPECPPPGPPCHWKYPKDICQGNTATFQYYVIQPSTTYAWQFVGGVPSTALGAGPHTITYPNAGTFPVVLTIGNAAGMSVCMDSITVHAPPAASVNQSGNALYAQPSGMSYQWYNASSAPPTLISGANSQYFSPTSTGNYCVIVSNPFGCSDTACYAFIVPDTGCCSFTFISDSVWCELSPDGLPQYHFNFKVDGCGTLSLQSLNNGFISLNNPYILTGGITNISGIYTSPSDTTLCILFMMHNNISYCADTVICFSLPQCQPTYDPCEQFSSQFTATTNGLSVNFTDMSLAGGGLVITSWSWEFGDPGSGANNYSTLQNPSHTYPSNGWYQVCLVVTAQLPGSPVICTDTVCKNIFVEAIVADPCDKLEVSYTYTANALIGIFTDLSTAAGGLVVLGWYWNFGDPASGMNNTSTLQHPNHAFSSAGTYTVCLVVIAYMPGSPVFCTGISCQEVVVKEAVVDPCDSLAAEFSYHATGLGCQFTDLSTSAMSLPITGWFWDFGDPASGNNNTSTQQHPSHIFTASGYYTVCLTVIAEKPDGEICADTVCKYVYVTIPIVSAGNDTLIFVGGSAILNGTVSGGYPPYSYLWWPDTGLSDPTIPNPVASPTATTVYTLVVTDSSGVSGSDEVMVTVVQGSGFISGTVSYGNAVQTSMSSTTVYLYKDGIPVYSAPTDASGHYEFPGVDTGTYLVTAGSSLTWGGGNATDALIVMKHFVSLLQLTGLVKKAGDVDANNYLNATDALAIMKRFVGTTSSFPSGDWAFEEQMLTVSEGDIITHNFLGLCYGDVNGSYTPPNLKERPSVDIEQDGASVITNPAEILIPVRIRKATVPAAVSLVMEFPAQDIIITAVTAERENQNLLFHTKGNELRIAWYNLDPVFVEDGDLIFTISARLRDGSKVHEIPPFAIRPQSCINGPDGSEIADNALLMPLLMSNTDVFRLDQNVPNPYTGMTRISYYIPESGHIRLEIYDMLGKQAGIVHDQFEDSGYHYFDYRNSGLDEGLYLYRMIYTVGQRQQELSHRMMISR